MRDNKPIISRVELNNFKCHSSFKEDFSCLTILAGENAAGKSSVIQSLLLYDTAARSSSDSVFTLDVHGINLGTSTSIITESSGSDVTEIKLTVMDEPMPIVFSIADDNDVSFDTLKNKGSGLKTYRFFYVNAERISPRAYYNISSSNAFNVGTHGENTVYVINQIDNIVKNPFYNDKKEKWKLFSDNSRFSAIVEDCLQTIIPGTKLNVKTNTEQGTSAIRYSNGFGIDVIPTATGFGITYVLPIIVQSLVSLLFSDVVLIIENPEAHLHPYSQSQLGRFLAKIASLGVQTVIETHSEHIINGCRLALAEIEKNNIASIIFFSRDYETMENHHTTIKIDKAGELSEWPEGFFDQSEKDLFEVIKNKCKK